MKSIKQNSQKSKRLGNPEMRGLPSFLTEDIDTKVALINTSAAASLEEGLEETLTLQRLGVFQLLGISFKTTNCIEPLNAQVEKVCGRVTHWKNSNHKQRWLAAALLDIEPRLRKIKGYQHLPKLRLALMKELKLFAAETKQAA